MPINKGAAIVGTATVATGTLSTISIGTVWLIGGGFLVGGAAIGLGIWYLAKKVDNTHEVIDTNFQERQQPPSQNRRYVRNEEEKNSNDLEENKINHNEHARICKVIYNPGNDWFMGAALQSLLSLPEFVRHFSQRRKLRAKRRNSFDFDEEQKHWGGIVDEMKTLVNDYSNSLSDQIDARALRAVFEDEFPTHQEHDASLFLMSLFSKIQKEENRRKKVFISKGYRDFHEAWKRYEETHSSIIDKLFVGMYETTFQCKGCSQVTKAYEEFSNIPLQCDPDDSKAGFCEFLNSSKQKQDHSQLRWRNWKTVRDWSMSQRIIKYPKYLILVFQRQDPINETRINKLMDYPQSFKILDPSTKANLKYTLNSSIIHEKDLGCSHYSTICLRNKSWFHLTPSSCTKIAPRKVKDSNTYILFYSTKNLPSV